ncbi:MAG: LON peptidase substrate-binding domain-containing protein [Gemmatimonadota bacterium]
MYRLPLFPLPVVLFPEARLPLHVFEPRYRRMVARCLEYDRRFGLIYHDADRAGPFLCEDGRVGCVAEIQSFQPLPDGRSLILALGVGRFALQDGIESGEPFYEAVVEPYEDRPDPDHAALRAQRRRSLQLFESAVQIVGEGDGAAEEVVPAMDTGSELSFVLAATLRIQPEWKQAFLELRDERQRLERLDAIFEAAARGARDPGA